MTTNKRNMASEEIRAEVEAKISHFSEPNKKYAARMHELIMQAAPDLHPRLWYGMPGYAKTKDSAVLVFFREDEYMTFGLTEAVALQPNDGRLMACAWFFKELDDATENKILEIVRKAVS